MEPYLLAVVKVDAHLDAASPLLSWRATPADGGRDATAKELLVERVEDRLQVVVPASAGAQRRRACRSNHSLMPANIGVDPVAGRGPAEPVASDKGREVVGQIGRWGQEHMMEANSKRAPRVATKGDHRRAVVVKLDSSGFPQLPRQSAPQRIDGGFVSAEGDRGLRLHWRWGLGDERRGRHDRGD